MGTVAAGRKGAGRWCEPPSVLKFRPHSATGWRQSQKTKLRSGRFASPSNVPSQAAVVLGGDSRRASTHCPGAPCDARGHKSPSACYRSPRRRHRTGPRPPRARTRPPGSRRAPAGVQLQHRCRCWPGPGGASVALRRSSATATSAIGIATAMPSSRPGASAKRAMAGAARDPAPAPSVMQQLFVARDVPEREGQRIGWRVGIGMELNYGIVAGSQAGCASRASRAGSSSKRKPSEVPPVAWLMFATGDGGAASRAGSRDDGAGTPRPVRARPAQDAGGTRRSDTSARYGVD